MVLKVNQTRKAIDKVTNVSIDSVAYPCGLVAKYYFNDTYQLYNADTGERIIINEKNIALSADKNYRFQPVDSSNMNKAWLDTSDEHVMVWY